jgi:hypothetical protein
MASREQLQSRWASPDLAASPRYFVKSPAHNTTDDPPHKANGCKDGQHEQRHQAIRQAIPTLWELLVHGRKLAFMLLGGIISAPPIAALIGIIIGETLFRLKTPFRPPVRSEP